MQCTAARRECALALGWRGLARAGEVFAIPRLDLTMTFIAASLSEIKGIALLEVGIGKLES